MMPRPPEGPVRSLVFTFLLLLLAAVPGPLQGQEGGQLTFQDLMKVRQIRGPSISTDGDWVALTAVPDRGDGEVLVYSTDGRSQYSIPLGAGPIISADGRWVASRLGPSFEERETAEPGEQPRPGLSLLETETGGTTGWDDVKSFGFSGDGAWLARLLHAPEGESVAGEGEPEEEATGEDEPLIRDDPGTTLVLRELGSGFETEIPHVARFAFDDSGDWIAYVVAEPQGEGDGLFVRRLDANSSPMELAAGPFSRIESMVWWDQGTRLAWVMAEDGPEGRPGPGSLYVWDGRDPTMAISAEAMGDGWILPAANDLSWSRDGERLFYGARPMNQGEREEMGGEVEAGGDEAFDAFDLGAILEGREVDVWHTEDPLINPNQKLVWNRTQNRTFVGVYHLGSGRSQQLGDSLVQLQGLPENPRWALGTSDVRYLKERTWTGGFEDIYLVDMDSGERTMITEGVSGGGSAANSWIGVSGPSVNQSPGGRYVVWFNEDHWHLYDAEDGSTRTLTEGMDRPFFDVDHDFPNRRGGHGLGGWLQEDEAVLIHDKYDLWKFPTDGGAPVNLTEGRGRSGKLILRVLRVDPDQVAFSPSADVHLASFDETDKSFGFYETNLSRGGLVPLLDQEKKFRFLAKAEDADRVLFIREDYDEFPDVWVSDLSFGSSRKVSDVNPELLDRFDWGTSELVTWTSDDGVPLQGVVIKPSDYDPEKRYPVLTYFYRFFSQRLHEFNAPLVNHRPSFPIYASDGYVVFLPDVRFEVGRPGISSLKSVVPGLKKLVEIGLADPNALGLHGHSWSGYTTAYIVTQTNIFAAAVAGAPVSNMTSAYGGIRWGTGLARQFQYEAGQSRLSGSLWEARPDYIENSPLFYADRVETPLVLMHGDEDEAVPWYQSIEFYLALRRTGKHAVFLQYRGEPHHPQKYPNKLDYSIKMKEFFDHYLKGAPAPEWWSKGEPYSGR